MGRRTNRHTIMRPLGQNPKVKKHFPRKKNCFDHKKAKRNAQKFVRRQKRNPTQQLLQQRVEQLGREEMLGTQQSLSLHRGPSAVAPTMMSELKTDEVVCPITEIQLNDSLPIKVSLNNNEYLFYGYEECQRCYIGTRAAVLNGGYIYMIEPGEDVIMRQNPWTNQREIFCDLRYLSLGLLDVYSLDVDMNGDYLYAVVHYERYYSIVRISTSTRIEEIVYRSRTEITAFAIGRFGLLLFATRRYLHGFQYVDGITGKVIKWKLLLNLMSCKFESISSICQTLEGSIYIMVKCESRSNVCWLPCTWDANCEPSWGQPVKFSKRLYGIRMLGGYETLFPSMSGNTLNCRAFGSGATLNPEAFQDFFELISRTIDDCCCRSIGSSIPLVLHNIIQSYCYKCDDRTNYNSVGWDHFISLLSFCWHPY